MKTCCRCGHSIEGGSSLAVAGPLRARIPGGPIKLCPCCAEALLDWLRIGDGGGLSFRSPGNRPGRSALRRPPSWSIDSPLAAAGLP
jgi:hypothetical protein